jgi:hypothetical protein
MPTRAAKPEGSSTRREPITVVTDEEELAQLAYHRQGDEAMNSDAAIAERQRIRKERVVIAELEKCWQVVISTVRVARPDAETLSFDEYLQLSRACGRELLPEDEYDEEDVLVDALEEWDDDSGGDGSLCREDFLDSFFELGAHLKTIQ